MLSLTRCVLCTRVQVVTVNVGAAVAAADAAEGGDGISVAVTVAAKKRQGLLLKTRFVMAYCVDLMEKLFVYRGCRHFSLPVRVSVAYRVVPRVLLLVSCYIEAHFLPVALPLLPLALGRYVTLRGLGLC